MRIAVAGGTGLVGRMVVDAVEHAGHEVVVLSRSCGVDLTTGMGLQEAMHGVRAVVDVSNTTAADRGDVEDFFSAVATHLVDASTRAHVQHYVLLSIIGVDVVDLDYFFGKRRQENLVLTSPVPWTVLRAAQFHEYAEQVLAAGGDAAEQVPPMLCRPVAAAEVAAALADLAAGPPEGFALPLAGPEELRLVDMVQQVLDRRGVAQTAAVLDVPGELGRDLADGGLLPVGDFRQGVRTFAEHVATIEVE